MFEPVRYQVLGPVAAAGGEGITIPLGGKKQRLVLALLLVNAGGTVSDERLIDGVWGDEAPERARHALQTYISELRKVLDDEIRYEGGGYRLAIAPDAVDAHRFEALVEAGRQRLDDSPESAATLLGEALALWRGDPFADLGEAPSLQTDIHRLLEARVAAVEDRVQADLDSGRHADITAELDVLTREHPYRERLHGLHMLALYRSRRQAEALRAYDRTRAILADELGIDPSPDLQELHTRVLRQDPGLKAPVQRTPEPTPSESPAPAGLKMVRGFELRELLGQGDYGAVYRAFQASAGREVAVKVFRADYADAISFIRNFEVRAQRIAQLDHPHIVPLLDYWRDPHGAYVVMPWLRAGSVRSALAHGPWNLPSTLRMLDQVGQALSSSHRQGIVHGDVKATNVLLDVEGNALLGDFAMSNRMVDAAGMPQTTAPYAVTPEESFGRPLSPRSDVYALAILAIEVLSGSPPPQESPASALVRRKDDVPEAVIRVIERAAHVDPERRFGRVEDLLRELRRAAGADVVALSPAEREDAGPIRNPYKGLQAFQESDAPDFFGREALTERLLETVSTRKLVAVVGPSGSGKSSVVRAGLIPAIRAGAVSGSRDWFVSEMFPGSYPFEELEAALLRVAVERPSGLLGELLSDDRGLLRAVKQILPGDDSELLLVIDQFEELFSLTSDPEIRRLFLDGLATVADDERGRVRTLVTLRADFFDRPLEHHAFGELMRVGLVPVTVPSTDELALAVSRPAQQVGVEYEPGLVGAIVREVADQPGGLPLLQHALTEVFGRREVGVLTLDAYRTTGGVLGALGRRADQIYRSLSAEGQSVARQVFLRLVSVDEHTEDARRRVRRSELAALEGDQSRVDAVIREFGAHRLLSFDRDPVTRGPTVEVAHEALFREWGALRGWIDSRREDLLLNKRLAAAVEEWRASGRRDEYLLAGGRLDQFEHWAGATDLALTEDERAFLRAGRAREEQNAARRRRRRVAIVAGSVAVAIVAGALAAFAVVQRGRAEREESAARARALAAESRNQMDVDHDLAVLLAVEAVEATRSAGQPVIREAVETLHRAVVGHRLAQTIDVGGAFLAFLRPNGSRLFSSGIPPNQPGVWDTESRQRVRTLPRGGGEPFEAAVSPDGRFAAETYSGSPTVVWDLRTGAIAARLRGPGQVGMSAAFSPDARFLAVVNAANNVGESVSLWDVRTGTERRRLDVPGDSRAVAYSPDGRSIAVGDWQAALVRLFDVSNGKLVATFGDPDDSRGVPSVAFDPSGERLAMLAFPPGEAIVFDLETGERDLTLPLGGDAGRVCFSGDGRILAATSGDKKIHVWDAIGGREILQLPGSPQLQGLACSSDGTRVAGTTPSGSARVWDVTAAGAGEVLSIPAPPPWTAIWSDDGRVLISTHRDGAVRMHDASTGRLMKEAGDLPPFPPWWIAASPDGRYLGLNANPYGNIDPAKAPVDIPVNARLAVHNAATLRPIRNMAEGGFPTEFSRDGRLFAAVDNGTLRIFDVETGRIVREFEPPVDDGSAHMGLGAFHPDGRHYLAVGAGRRESWLFDIETGEVEKVICASNPAFRARLSPDGLLAAVGGQEIVEIWDLDRVPQLGDDAEPICDARGAPSDAVRLGKFSGGSQAAMNFSADGTKIAAASFDGELGVWNARTGERILRLEHAGAVGGAAFSPDGRHIVVTFNDRAGALHAIRVYTLDLGELLDIARDKVTRGLTEAECRTYLQRNCSSA